VQYKDEKPQRFTISLFHFNMCKGSQQHAIFSSPRIDGKLLNFTVNTFKIVGATVVEWELIGSR